MVWYMGGGLYHRTYREKKDNKNFYEIVETQLNKILGMLVTLLNHRKYIE